MLQRREFFKRASLGLAGGALSAGMGARAARAAAPANVFDVKAFGAKGDGKTLDTPAINKAIEAAAAAGGTVGFPAGDYLCFSIHLKSNVALDLDDGATIVAADTPEGGADGYDPAEPNSWDRYQDFGHSHFHNSLIWGEGIANVAITGRGRIWGKGLSKGQGAMNPGVGNKSISLKNCHNVLLRDFSILHGGHFGILATGVDNLTIDNLKIDTNRDGMDVDSCRNVRISNCSVNSPWDDGICLKADYALGAARATEFVTIVNCYVSGCWEEGTLLDGTFRRFGPEARVPYTGRIKFGTESNGGFRNITVSNCVFEGCQGLALETVDGGLLEDVTVTNISMRDIMSAPIFMRLGRRLRAPDGTAVGTLKRVMIGNLVCSGSASALGSIISGIPGHPVEDVKISNIEIRHQGGGSKEDAAYQPPENEDCYPEPDMFTVPATPGRNGRGPNGDFVPEGQERAGAPPRQGGRGAAGAPPQRHKMPSHGFYLRHVKGIQFDNVEIQAAQEDRRPAFVLDDVQDADFFRVKTPRVAETPVFALHNVADLSVHMCSGVKDTQYQKATPATL
jgi:polygalacturonase